MVVVRVTEGGLTQRNNCSPGRLYRAVYHTSSSIKMSEQDIFSDTYLESFYKAHIASRGTRRSTIDEDIAAIEAEIRKVQQYRSRVKKCQVSDQHQLNSCGNSECSDDEDLFSGSTMESMPTSVFRVYNSSKPSRFFPRRSQGVDVFAWAQYQLVLHDHSYLPSSQLEPNTPLDNDDIALDTVEWCHLANTRRVQALKKLSSILRHNTSPQRCCSTSSSVLSAPSSSLSLLPSSLAESIRTNKGVVAGTKSKVQSSQLPSNLAKLNSSLLPSLSGSVPVRAKKIRQLPYERKIVRPFEVTRVRNSSTCSEESLEVD